MQRQQTGQPGGCSPYFCRRPCSNRSSTTLRTVINCSRSSLASLSLQISRYYTLVTVLVRYSPLTVVSQCKEKTERPLPSIRTSWTSSDRCGTIGDITLVITSSICQRIQSASMGSEKVAPCTSHKTATTARRASLCGTSAYKQSLLISK
jgi:hypothetical protein